MPSGTAGPGDVSRHPQRRGGRASRRLVPVPGEVVPGRTVAAGEPASSALTVCEAGALCEEGQGQRARPRACEPPASTLVRFVGRHVEDAASRSLINNSNVLRVAVLPAPPPNGASHQRRVLAKGSAGRIGPGWPMSSVGVGGDVLEQPRVEEFLKGLNRYPATTMGHLITFMHSFNLRFGPATSSAVR